MGRLSHPRIIMILLGLAVASGANAQIRIDDGLEEIAAQHVNDLVWADRNDLNRQAEAVERIGQRHYGQSLRHDKTDLVLLQRIADDRLIKQEDRETLQGLGVILGNVLRDELDLEWKIYEDAVGRSRALCVPGTVDCLFPVTMLSRRLETGLTVDVNKIYNDAVEAIEPYLPNTEPFAGPKPDVREKPSWIDDRPQRPPARIRVN